MPLNDLDDYTPAPAGAGGGASPAAGSPDASAAPPSTPSPDAPASPAAGGGAGGSGGSGLGGSGGSSGAGVDGPSPPAPSPDAGSAIADAAPTPTAPCAAGELEGPDQSCFFLDASAQTFFAARSACQARGSGWDLASVRSAAASAFLGDVLGFEGWLVASDVVNEGTWVWLNDGSPFWQGGTSGAPVGAAYANWNATEPNGGTTTNCMRALPRSAGSANPDAPWADLACTALRGGICQGPSR